MDRRTIEPGLSKKLAPCFVGPYYITDLAGPYTYQLRLVENNVLLKVPVHANRLKPYVDPRLRKTNSPDEAKEIEIAHDDIQDEIQRVETDENEKVHDERQGETNDKNTATDVDEEVTNTSNDIKLGQPDVYKVKRIMAHKVINGMTFYKIHWDGYSAAEATWEPSSHVSKDLIQAYKLAQTVRANAKKRRKRRK